MKLTIFLVSFPVLFAGLGSGIWILQSGFYTELCVLQSILHFVMVLASWLAAGTFGFELFVMAIWKAYEPLSYKTAPIAMEKQICHTSVHGYRKGTGRPNPSP